MRILETKVYSFDELNEKAKEKAIEDYRNTDPYDGFYYDEILESVKAVCELFNLKTGREYSDIRTDHIDDNILELSGARLYTYLVNNYVSDFIKPNYISKHKDGSFKNSDFQYKYDCLKYRRSNIFSTNNFDNCPLTGVCYDNDILQPIEDFLKKPDKNTTFEDLMDEIGSAINSTYRNTEEWLYSEEFIVEELQNREDEFTENGKMI